jgi:2-(1,2-epoxy-1,2-dihydrophenyl)acetyl-CoA isomerase
MEVVGFDRPISSGEALAWGLVTKVAEDGKVLEEARKMARELGERSLHSFGWCKQLLVDSFHTPFESHIERERQGLSSCAAHPNGQEGLKAFLEKRKPKFNVK